MEIPFSPPLITEDEIAEVVDTLRSGWITTGPKTKKFEKMITEYCETDATVCLNSATAALELTMRVFGIGEGDEVITSAYTYTATAAAIHHTGAKIIMVDCNASDYLINCDAVENAITEKTKAIVPVDIAGVPCDYIRLKEIVNNKKDIFKPNNELQSKLGRIAIITDGAHSIGAEYMSKKSCRFSDFTAFSFHAVKNLTTGEGGAVTWNKFENIDSEELYKKYQLLSLHGQSKDALSKMQKGAWEYDVIEPLYKCNMTDIMASIGIHQLEKYDGYVARRHKIIDKYNKAFKDIGVITHKHSSNHFCSSGHLYLLKFTKNDIDYRNTFINKMAEKGVSCNVHYKPLPLLTAYKNLGYDIKEYPVAYNNYINEISLPLFNSITDEQVDYAIEAFLKTLEEM